MILSTELARLAEAATPGEWLWDAGLIPPDGPGSYADIYVIDEQREPITLAEFNDSLPEGRANAALIAAMCSEPNRKTIIAALKAAETPLGDYAGLVERLRDYAKDWRDRAASQEIVIEAADTITALSRLLAEREAEVAAAIESGWREGYCAGAYRPSWHSHIPPNGVEVSGAWDERQKRLARQALGGDK